MTSHSGWSFFDYRQHGFYYKYFYVGDKLPMNSLIFNMLGSSFEQSERNLIIHLTSELREHAKKQGKHLGTITA